MIKRDVTLILAIDDDGQIQYSLFNCELFGLLFGRAQFELHREELLSSFVGDVYVLGYLYEGRFFDQLFYIGKGKVDPCDLFNL